MFFFSSKVGNNAGGNPCNPAETAAAGFAALQKMGVTGMRMGETGQSNGNGRRPNNPMEVWLSMTPAAPLFGLRSAWVDFFTYWASFTPGGQSAVFSEMTARPAEPNGAGGAGHPPKVKAQAWAEREATALNAVRLNRRASSDESDADAGSRRAVNGVSPEIVDAQWKKLKSVGQRSAELAAEKPAQPPVSSRQKPAASTPKPVASSKREAAFGAGASTSATKRSAPGDTAEAEVAPASKPAPKTRRKSTATLRVVSNEPAPEKAKTPARKRVAKAAAKPVEPEGPRKPKRLMKKAPAKSDDLKQIRGIGPGLEKTLNGLGIYKFSQIAAMGKPEIEWVESHLQKFQGRAERDDWVGQASKLAR